MNSIESYQLQVFKAYCKKNDRKYEHNVIIFYLNSCNSRFRIYVILDNDIDKDNRDGNVEKLMKWATGAIDEYHQIPTE